MSPGAIMNAVDAVIAYHEATKHHPNRFARSLGYLDWANQPDPFRRFEGAPVCALPLVSEDTTPAYDALFSGEVSGQTLNIETLGAFFEHSLAISAWKAYGGDRWALRCNPSSGNLHPTEGYAVLGPMEGLHDEPAVYHYAPKEHALERRGDLSPESWQALASVLPKDAFLVGLSSIHWREAWKYGERAFRYCQHDVGHAFAALSVAAAALGWRLRWLDTPGDAETAGALGLMRRADFVAEESEHPDLLAVVWPGNTEAMPVISSDAFKQAGAAAWHGTANRLSREHVPWTAIDDVAKACIKARTESRPIPRPNKPGPATSATKKSARSIILQRRSAQAMDGQSVMPREAFYRTLMRCMPDRMGPVWEAFSAASEAHLIVFVHRVTGMPPGVYCLVRNTDHEKALRESMRSEFTWVKAMGCPDELPFYLLQAGDCRQLAGQLSCGQDIAADGAFAVAMLARFEAPLQAIGAWYYRTLFWETGIIGQLLYLEAEATGLRGTGIGCYFDDLVHQVLGLKDRHFQSLYHFTVGGPLDDPRLTTLAPYGDREREE